MDFYLGGHKGMYVYAKSFPLKILLVFPTVISNGSELLELNNIGMTAISACLVSDRLQQDRSDFCKSTTTTLLVL